MTTKKKLLLCIGVLAVALAVWACVALLSGNDAQDYNTAATQRAWTGKQIPETDILLLDSIDKDPGGDSKAQFLIFRLPEGGKAADYLHLQAADCTLEQLGTASCTFIGDDPASIYDLTTVYSR